MPHYGDAVVYDHHAVGVLADCQRGGDRHPEGTEDLSALVCQGLGVRVRGRQELGRGF